MNQKRLFFATLNYARRTAPCDRVLRRVLLSCFQYGYSYGWHDRNTDVMLGRGKTFQEFLDEQRQKAKI